MDQEHDKNESDEEKSFPTASLPDSSVVLGDQIGPYTLRSVLGEGGFAIVYLAEQKHPLKRLVALKILKPGMDSKQVIARFEAERQALALLDHPNIAHVFEAGSTESGKPYFAMEYIRGMPITDYCDHHQLKIEERLKLFIQVCQAVQHAHQKGIIHRDIKPSNIVVNVQEGKATPKVIDFGIAKAISMPLTEKIIFTQQGQLVGTPEYMSPEQADLREKDVDTRTDIYSLGVVLYELLSGTLPFDPKTLREAGFARIQQVIREQDPPLPSTKLSSLGENASAVARNRHTELSTLIKHLHQELEWIPLKAIRKDREQRYKTASDLAEDVQNYLDGNPLTAGPESARYRFYKFVRRHKGPAAALTAIAALTIVSLITITHLYLRSEKSRMETEKQSYCNNIVLADTLKVNNAQLARQLLDSCPMALRGWEWDWLYYNLDQTLFTINRHQGNVHSVCFSPDSKRIVSGGDTLIIWDAEKGRELRTLFGSQADIRSVRFSPDGKTIVSGDGSGTIKIWDADTGTTLQTLTGHKSTILSVAYSPDGKRIVSGSSDDTIKVWDVESGCELRTLSGHTGYISSVCFSPDRKEIASGSGDKTIKIWDAENGTELRTLSGHQDQVLSISYSPDGKRIASGSDDDTIKIWDAENGTELRTLGGHQDQVLSISYSPDGKRITSGSLDKTIKIWDADIGTELRTLSGHRDGVYSVCFSPDGRWIASGSEDKTIKIWDAENERELRIPSGHQGNVTSICFSPDGKRIAMGIRDPNIYEGKIIIRDTDSWTILRILGGPEEDVFSVCFSPDGKRIACGGFDDTIKIWDIDSGTKLRTLIGHEEWIFTVCFSPDGKRIASASADKTIKIWDADSGTELRTLSGHREGVLSVCFSPDGKRIASGGVDKTIKIWDADSGNEIRTLNGHKSWVFTVCFSPDGKRIASGANFLGVFGDTTIKVWDTDSGTELRTLIGHEGGIYKVSFSPDGKRILSGKLWDIDTGRELLTLSNQQIIMPFSPDGKQIVAGGGNDSITLFDIRRAAELDQQRRMIEDKYTKVLSVWDHIDNGKLDDASKLMEDLRSSADPSTMRRITASLRQGYSGRAYDQLSKCNYSDAIDDYETAVHIEPDYIDYGYIESLNALSKLRSTCPVAQFRDSKKALEVAALACKLTKWKDHDYFHQLAIAYSLVGDFDNAVKWQKEAIALLPKGGWYDRSYKIYTAYLNLFQSGIAYGETVSTGKLVGWWNFDEALNNHVLDSSGQGQEGKLIGDAKIVADPQRGNVLCLDGEGAYVDCGTKPAFNIVGAITVSCWIKITKFDKDELAIVTKGVDYAWRLRGLKRHNKEKTLEFVCWGLDLDVEGAQTHSLLGPMGLDDDRWHYIVGVYDGKKVCLYVDGILNKSVNAYGWLFASDDPVIIGKLPNAGQSRQSMKRLIDDVRIYDYALNAKNIKALYENKELPGIMNPYKK